MVDPSERCGNCQAILIGATPTHEFIPAPQQQLSMLPAVQVELRVGKIV